MLRKLKILFFVLLLVSAAVWILGLLLGVTIPIFGGVRADKIGGICFSISLAAEVFMHFFGWLFQREPVFKDNMRTQFHMEKKYGHRKPPGSKIV